jgi:hypothetical protein
LNLRQTGFYLGMNATTKLEMIRDMARSKVMELQPFAGEEMSLPQTDSHRDGFIDGERTLAAQILDLIDEKETSPAEEEMVLGR